MNQAQSISNPHLAFSQFRPDTVTASTESIISENLQSIETLLQQEEHDWQNLLAPLEELNDRLEKHWAPVSHMNAVMQNEALREAYEQCLPLLSNYSAELGQNRKLFDAFNAYAASAEFASLSGAQKRFVENQIRDFKLAGVALSEEQQQRFKQIKQRLSELANQFSNNVLDATQAWRLNFSDAEPLQGLPESALNSARAAANARGETGFTLTLDAPCYIAVMTYAEDRQLREQMYIAYSTRASDQGPQGGEYDNSAIMAEICALRQEIAGILDFANYAEYSLATKMAREPEQVLDFLQQLADKSRPVAKQELATLEAFVSQEFSLAELQAWDIAYYSEKLRQRNYDLDKELLRPYFPAEHVLAGLFDVAGQLFEIEIIRNEDVETWHDDAACFDVFRDKQLIARFYLDLYVRENKRGGAWMADCQVRRRLAEGELQLPVAFLTCNFSAPNDAQPSLLSFDEVSTLFHEFGHGLHHMLTRVEVAGVSGINGVAWDAVELPSQFLENWCWQADVISRLSQHYQDGSALPDNLLEKLLAAKNFQAGLQMLRQLEFAMFDFKLHMQTNIASAADIQTLLNTVREQVAVLIPPASNRFQHGFSHIFAGGYAAGYYSYKWAEVLSADAFSVFESEGIFDKQCSIQFRTSILEQGGAADAMELFKQFMGREPQVDALLRHNGIHAGIEDRKN